MSLRQFASVLVVALGMNVTASAGIIIDDKSDFAGDYTVIDFETWGDGRPIDLEEGLYDLMPADEYGHLGVTMSASPSTGYPPQSNLIVVNGAGPQSDAAQALVGSPPNTLADFDRHGFLRFDFQIPVNAIGIAVMRSTAGEALRLGVFDASSTLIEAVDFDAAVIDGAILGSDFGNPFDTEYGFFGVFSPTCDISYALLTDDLSSVDDLHFGIIPEPGSVALLGLVGLGVLMRRRHGRGV